MSKTAVVGLRESTGKVRTKVIPDVSTLSLSLFIDANVKEGVTIVTDEYSGYNSLYKKYNHETVNHKAGTYCYNGFHTNGIENFWSQLKRGIYGIYHQVSPKHLSRYCDEFSYRHNERKISDDYRFTLSLARVTGRLTYKQLIAKDANQEA
jgi:transposase-like protein